MNFLRRVRDSKRKEEDTKKFLIFITQLEPAHVFGVAKILGVDLKAFQNDEEENKGELLLDLMIQRFSEMNKTRRFNLLKLIEASILEGVEEARKEADRNISEAKNEKNDSQSGDDLNGVHTSIRN